MIITSCSKVEGVGIINLYRKYEGGGGILSNKSKN